MQRQADLKTAITGAAPSGETVARLPKFPREFRWGVATSSYQIEGAADQDGRGRSIWDTFCQIPGNVVNAEDGLVACDHYNRYLEDVQLMSQLGVQAYRFSIAWPRLFPAGDRVREPRGFEFYDRLVDSLLAAGIQPMATLYHWDLPQSLQDIGGWANREIVGRFADYSEAVVQSLGDRVTNWVTVNEPWCVSWLGYMNGVHAPGVKDLDSAVASAHHTALAHAEATRAIRAISPRLNTGLAANMTVFRVDDPRNPELAELQGLMDSHINRWWIDAAFKGSYPTNLVENFGERLERVLLPGDLDRLRVDNEFLGVNYYSDSFISTPLPTDAPMADGGLFPFPQRANGATPEPKTAMGWPVTPAGIRDLMLRIGRDWPQIPQIFVTENGAAFDDEVDSSGDVNDAQRVEYLEQHLIALSEAVEAGVPIKGYFAWSLMDNFEWAEGYGKRFGLVHVDWDTLVRTPKRSARVYKSLIYEHGQFWGSLD